jgi:hypothetical protein
VKVRFLISKRKDNEEELYQDSKRNLCTMFQ